MTDPGRPEVLWVLPGHGSSWRSMKVYDEYAYIVSEAGPGIQVVDLHDIDSGVLTHVNTVDSGADGHSHNCALDTTSGFFYRIGHIGVPGLRIYDLADPVDPAFVAAWPNAVHDACVITYIDGPFAGRQIAFCCTTANDTLSLVDVTDKSDIFVITELVYPNAHLSHQVSLSEDHQWAFLNDEGDHNDGLPSTTYVFDVADINAASYVTSFTNGNPAITHDAFVKDDLLFCANRSSGLRVFDVSDPLAAFETAWYDTWPVDDSVALWSLKSVCPYFDSGIVIGSSSQQGFFVWTYGTRKVSFAYPVPLPDILDPAGHTVAVELLEGAPGDLAPGTAALHFDMGAGEQEVPLVPVGGDVFRATLPSLPCGALVEYYFSAQSTNGFTWTDPPASTTRSERYYATAAVEKQVVFADDFESDLGWTSEAVDGGHQGFWERARPIGTALAPEQDYTPGNGTMCWVTDNGEASANFLDYAVRGGPFTLTSPVFDLSGMTDPLVGYARWYANDGNDFNIDDEFSVDVTADGANWVNVETIGLPGMSGGWTRHQFRVLDYVPLTASIQVRFVAIDRPNNSGVEAAIDDFEVFEAVPPSEAYCTAAPNSVGPGALIGTSGTINLAANDFTLLASEVPSGQFGLFFYGPAQTETPFGNGFLCVAAGGLGLFRLQPPQPVDLGGEASRSVDFSAPPEPEGQITAGSTWHFQFWYRDPAAGGAAFNLSHGLSATFCP